MLARYKKIYYLIAFSFIALYVSFFCSCANIVLAEGMDIEMLYPDPKETAQKLVTETKLPDFAVDLFNLGMVIGLFSVSASFFVGGIMFAISPISAELRSSAKDRMAGATSGFLILVTTYLIITTINPQLSIFKLEKLEDVPLPAVDVSNKKAPGVYFFKEGGCSNNSIEPTTASIASLPADLIKKITSVSIVQDEDTDTYFVSTLYENANFWGRCQYINPNATCVSSPSFASSASVHVYDFEPKGRGVYFFRKSCFNTQAATNLEGLISSCKKNSGGYFEVKNSEIKGGYLRPLEDLIFSNVPEEEKNCVEYDKEGICTRKEAPALSGENISSIILNGNYLVELIYFGQGDNSSGPWTLCQEFPSVDDTDKIGPRQIKWEDIRNYSSAIGKGALPNYVSITPIKN